MNAAHKMTPHIKTIEAPAMLRALPAWLVWRYEHHEGEPKPRKVPYYTSGGRRHGVQGRPEDRNQLTTFDAAKSAAARRGFDGVGFALLPEWGVTALDFDKCVTGAGIDPEVERIVTGTYAEYSPSGEGVRAFVLGSLGNSKSHVKDGAYGFETFSSKGFCTFTGNRLEVCDLVGTSDVIAPAGAAVLSLCTERFGPRDRSPLPADDFDALDTMEPQVGLTEDQLREALDVLDADMGHDTWLHVGMAIHHETDGEGFALWDEWSAKGGKYPGAEVLATRWESFGRHTGRPVTARTLIKLANENGAYIMAPADDFDVVADEPAAPGEAPKAPRFQVVPAHEFAKGAPPKWIVKDVLPQATLAVVFGDSGSGKTFFTLDVVGAVARGIEWRGKRVAKGRAVYIVAEGAGGFRNRLKAYAHQHQLGLEQLDIGVIGDAPNFMVPADIKALLAAVKAYGPTDIIVVDTFAQVMPGSNENSGEDVGRALAHCRALHKHTGALVILVHHSGKDSSKGARGWSGLRAAADAEIEIVRADNDRVATVTKLKDGSDGAEFGFQLQTVTVDLDEDGEEVTSCVIEHTEAVPKAQRRREPKGVKERLVLRMAAEMMGLSGEAVAPNDLIDNCVGQLVHDEGSGRRDTRRQTVMRAMDALIEGGQLVMVDGKVKVGG